MVKIRQVGVEMLDKPKASPSKRELTPRQRERLAQQRQFERMLRKIADRDTVFEVRLEAGEKAFTVRQRLMKAAETTGKEIVVRKSEKGWLVAMSTPDRKSRRGRRPAAAKA
jgi:hypothetical protein